ncbi:MAG: hypothetical protein IPM47_14030 [Sphingobacteriales bacterium]|nr:MAG: hypothetical protein IPM47_14030 [Sphingobacteriales bacterium]
MKYKVKILLFLPLLFFAFALHGQNHSGKCIKKSFKTYRNALMEENGKKATQRVAKPTIEYYGKMLEHARYSDSITLSSLPLIDKLMVISFRNRVPSGKLMKISPKQSVVYAIDKGMVGKEGLSDLSLGKITVIKKKAEAQLVLNNDPIPVNFVFYKECLRWKIDLTAFFPLATIAIQQTAKDLEMNENELIQFIVQLVEPYQLHPKLWIPVADWNE